MCYCLPVAGHDAITQLNDLWDADDLFGVVALVGQQNQEKENTGHDLFRVPTQKIKSISLVQTSKIIIIYICAFEFTLSWFFTKNVCRKTVFYTDNKKVYFRTKTAY